MRAIPQHKVDQEQPTDRDFEVLSRRCVYGEVGDVVTLKVTDGQELSLVQSGAVKRAENRPTVATRKEGKANG